LKDIKFFKDDYGNFYSTYHKKGFESGGPVGMKEYIRIDAHGKKTDLRDVYKIENDLRRKFESLTPVKF